MEELSLRSISALLLTGSETMTETLNEKLSAFSNVEILTWLPYEEAYQVAMIAVGHGGTSHLWTGMSSGTPLLVIPSVGDQVFGGSQVEKLNIGRMLNVEKGKSLLDKVLNKVEKNGGLDIKQCKKALNELLDDPSILKSSHKLMKKMEKGGGAQAGALLVERLANERTAITQCTDNHCCC